MKDEIDANIKNKINKIWDEELEKSINDKINSTIKNLYSIFDKELERNKKSICKMIENNSNIIENLKLKSKLNKCQKILNFENNNNMLINYIIICLTNIESLVMFCLTKNNDLKKLKEEKALFSYLIQLIRDLWLGDATGYSGIPLMDKFLQQLENKIIFYCRNPGNIIRLFLTILSNELECIKPMKNNIDNYKICYDEESLKIFIQNMQNNYNEISKEFFVGYKIKTICKNCDVCIYSYEERPIVDLFIQKEDKEIMKENNISYKISLNEHFSFLLNNDVLLEKYCEICGGRQNFVIFNSIELLKNNILIINLNKEEQNRDISYGIHLELNNIFFELISVLMVNENIVPNSPNNVKTYNYRLYFKNFNDKNWYSYNNNKILKLENETEIINEKNALLLIYERRK